MEPILNDTTWLWIAGLWVLASIAVGILWSLLRRHERREDEHEQFDERTG